LIRLKIKIKAKIKRNNRSKKQKKQKKKQKLKQQMKKYFNIVGKQYEKLDHGWPVGISLYVLVFKLRLS